MAVAVSSDNAKRRSDFRYRGKAFSSLNGANFLSEERRKTDMVVFATL